MQVGLHGWLAMKKACLSSWRGGSRRQQHAFRGWTLFSSLHFTQILWFGDRIQGYDREAWFAVCLLERRRFLSISDLFPSEASCDGSCGNRPHSATLLETPSAVSWPSQTPLFHRALLCACWVAEGTWVFSEFLPPLCVGWQRRTLVSCPVPQSP